MQNLADRRDGPARAAHAALVHRRGHVEPAIFQPHHPDVSVTRYMPYKSCPACNTSLLPSTTAPTPNGAPGATIGSMPGVSLRKLPESPSAATAIRVLTLMCLPGTAKPDLAEVARRSVPGSRRCWARRQRHFRWLHAPGPRPARRESETPPGKARFASCPGTEAACFAANAPSLAEVGQSRHATPPRRRR